MATTTLPSASSIVDYLNSQKQDSSFSARKKLYTAAGLDKTLGDFVGSASQNLNLLKNLQNNSVPASATPATTAVNTAQAQPATTTPATALTQAPSLSAPVLSTQLPNTAIAHTTPATSVLSSAGFPNGAAPTQTPAQPAGVTTPAPLAPITQPAQIAQPVTPATTPAGTAGTYKGVAITPGNDADVQAQMKTIDTNAATQQTTGTSATNLYPDLTSAATASAPAESDLINQYLNSEEGQAKMDDINTQNLSDQAKADLTKQTLEAKYEGDKSTLEENLAEHGLAFSGIRNTQIAALAASLASSELGVDQDLATKLLNSNATLRDAIIKGVADLAAKAATDQKAAVAQLNAVGYAVINGQLVPTLANLSSQRADAAAVRAQTSLDISQKRLDLAEAAAAQPKTGNTLTFSEAVNQGLPLSLVGESEASVAQSLYSATPPAWFVEKANNEAGQTLLPAVVQAQWNEASQQYLGATKQSTSYTKAASYAKSVYGSALTPDQIQAFAQAVDTQVNGGLSYADAINAVVAQYTQ